ncbi:MAG: T9SS type A sorting domain-containing protein [Bacteroidales bacterium]|nr:T9SS type A sorting domain-containing protein [Bacteroidales bacterium]
MKIKIAMSLMFFSVLSTLYGQQSFERLYQYWNYGEGGAVFEEEDGYLLAGTGVDDLLNKFFLLKVGLNGDTLWMKQVELSNHSGSDPWIRCSLTDGSGNTCFFVSGVQNMPDFLKFDAQWNLLWKRKLEDDFKIQKMVVSDDNNIICVGQDSTGYCIRKLDTGGSTIWRSGNIYCNMWGYLSFSSIHEMPDNNIVLISSWMNNNWFQFNHSTITIYGPEGDSLSSSFFDPESGNFHIFETHLVEDDLLSIAVSTAMDETTSSLIRHKSDGTILRDILLGPEGSFYKMVKTGDGNLIALGSTPAVGGIRRMVLHCVTLTGDSLWSSYIGYTRGLSVNDIKYCHDKGILLGGFAGVNDWPDVHPYFVKTDSIGKISPLGISNLPEKSVAVYPNPAYGSVVIETPVNFTGQYTIYDSFGRICYSGSLNAEMQTIDLYSLKSGIYVYHITDNQSVFTGKLMVKAVR